MGNPLMPQQRVDKNGKLTTRHVKVMQTATSSAAGIPSPLITHVPESFKVKPAKPLDRQLQKKQRMISRKEFKSSPELRKALGIADDAWDLAIVSATEVQAFDVFSVVSLDNAINLLESGITSSNEALAFLNEHGLNDLVIDRHDMMQKAISLRVDSFALLDLHSSFGIENYDEDVFLGAARAKGSTMLPCINNDGAGTGTFHEGILKGEINYSDLTELTYSTVAMYNVLTQETYDGLRAIKDGSVDFGVKFLKRIVEHSMYDKKVFNSALEMADAYGHEFVEGLQGLHDASNIRNDFKERGAEYCRSLIEYNEMYRDNFHAPSNNFVDIQRLHDAGIAPSDFKHLKANGITIDQIISAKREGITGAVTGGWL